MSKQLKGSLMVLIAGIAWGFSGVSGQYLMAHGVNVNLLTSLRLLLSGILLTASVFFRQRDKLVQAIKDRKNLVSIALFARKSVCYFRHSCCDFSNPCHYIPVANYEK